MLGRLSKAVDGLFPELRFPVHVARVAVGLAVLGLAFALAGLGVFLALGDRFFGLALVIVGAFLMILPFTRPHVDE